MRFYLSVHNSVVGPYAPGDINGVFGRLAPDTYACGEEEYNAGRPDWRKISAILELGDCIPAPAAGSVRPVPAAKTSLEILSTDDDSGIRALLYHMLTDAGHTVEFARDGEEVFKRLSVKKYDLLILDVNMPKMNGYKVSELIHERIPDPPKVIIFTGRDLEAERLQFVCSDADAILNKGADAGRLLETIEGVFAAGRGKKGALGGRAAAGTPPAPLQKTGFFDGPLPGGAAGRDAAAPPLRPAEDGNPAPVPPPAPQKAEQPAAGTLPPPYGMDTGGLPARELAGLRRQIAGLELESARNRALLENGFLKLGGENRQEFRKLASGIGALRNCARVLLLLAAAALLLSLL